MNILMVHFQILHRVMFHKHLQLLFIMFSEQTFDHHMRRARNSTVGFIDGKVKSNKNNTLACLEDKHADEQDKIIVFSIAEAQKMQTEL